MIAVVQKRDEETVRKLVHDAIALARAGCYSFVLDSMPPRAETLPL
jgi:hypothetical protein